MPARVRVKVGRPIDLSEFFGFQRMIVPHGVSKKRDSSSSETASVFQT